MALTNNGTKVSIAQSSLPSGYTKPTVTEFTDYELTYSSRQMTIAKSTVENATASTTFTNLVSQLTTDINTLLAADIDTTGLTVTAWADFKTVTTNNSLSSILYTTGTLNYICTVDIYVKTA